MKILENENYYQREFPHEVTFFNKFVEDCESQEKPNTNSKLEIPSEDQVADALTKAVPQISFSKIRVLLGLSENSHNMGKYVKDVVPSIN